MYAQYKYIYIYRQGAIEFIQAGLAPACPIRDVHKDKENRKCLEWTKRCNVSNILCTHQYSLFPKSPPGALY